MKENPGYLLFKQADSFIETHQKSIFTALDFLTLGFGTLTVIKFFTRFPDGGMSPAVSGGAATSATLLKMAIIEHQVSHPH